MNHSRFAVFALLGACCACGASGRSPQPPALQPAPSFGTTTSPAPPATAVAAEVEFVSDLTNESEPRFSLDGRHVALVVDRDEAHFLLLDGTEIVRSKRNISHFAIARDGASVTYALGHVDTPKGQRHILVHRGVTSELAGEPVGVVVDAWRVMVATSTRGGDDGAVLIDGAKVASAIDARILTLGPDGKRWGFAGAVSNRTGGETVTIDGAKAPVRGAAWDLVFSPDARHVAYRVAYAGGASVVLDGKSSRTYRRIEGTVRFTSDGRLFYGAVGDAGTTVVVGGVVHGPYAAVGPIAGGEEHVAWAAETSKDARVVVTEVFLDAHAVWRDERERGAPLANREAPVHDLVVAATGRAAFRSGADVVLVRPSGVPLVIGQGTPIAFDPAGRLLALRTTERRLRVVDVETNRTLFVSDAAFDAVYPASLRFEPEAVRWYGSVDQKLVRVRKPLLTR